MKIHFLIPRSKIDIFSLSSVNHICGNSLKHRNVGLLGVVGDANEDWNLLVGELGVIAEKKKGID